ncbi:MAG: competence/damage-inducible protein A [Crocinitomicaceae bacterium]|nr:competence/damage-inducible protein A [Crocinitomicaceae bacterium]
MQAEIISIGDELLLGQTINTNASWISEQLALIGINTLQVTTIADDERHIIESLEAALKRADVVLITGGLGPTKDDITKKCLAEYFGTSLEMDQTVLAKIVDYFESRGREVLQVNKDQALLPKDARIIPNELGTASGMWFEKDGKIAISMPGVPYEMHAMMQESILPQLKDENSKLYYGMVYTQGMGESKLAELIAPWEKRIEEAGLKLAYLPSPGLVKLRITSLEGDKILVDELCRDLKQNFPKLVYSLNTFSIAKVVGEILKYSSSTVGTVESCTAGALSSMITSVPGASEYYMGSMITYSYEEKMKQVGVLKETLLNYGAVSEQTAKEMAEGGRKKLDVDYCISTTGIAGPDGGTKDKPVGTVWVAISSPKGTVAKKFIFGTDRSRNVEMTCLSALNFLRNHIFGYN